MRLPPHALFASALAATLVLSGLAGSTARAARLDLGATWAASPIVVDGNLDDWKGRLLTTVDAPLAVGAVNDGDFLYVALSSSDESVARRAYFRGLVVWIKPKKGTDIGIEYPTGEGRRARRPDAGGGAPPGPPPAGEASASFLMLGQGSSEGQRIAVDNPFGIEVKAALVNDRLAYELKIPLHRSAAHPYALDAKGAEAVTVAIESPEPERARRGPRPDGDERGGEGGEGGWGGGGMHHPGGGYGHGGGMGGMGGGEHARGGPRGGRPAPLKIEAKLHLATAPTTE